jgi:hypothetical protein
MLARVAEGWERAGGGKGVTLHLAQPADLERAIELFFEADVVLLGMPLYTDAMPALVKQYIEALGQRRAARRSSDGARTPTLGFLVQSGFPEALHSRPLERYLVKLARRLGAPCAGVIVHGDGEALQVAKDESNEKLWRPLRALGEELAREGRFGERELRAVAGMERFPSLVAALLSIAVRLPFFMGHWNRTLKRNGAWERRFATPYRDLS